MKIVEGVLQDVQNRDLIVLKKSPSAFWKGVIKIGENAFKGVDELWEIVIPEGVESIEAYLSNKEV